jgi:hypothetical protein
MTIDIILLSTIFGLIFLTTLFAIWESEAWIVIFGAMTVIAIVFYGTILLLRLDCTLATSGLPYENRFLFPGGCQIQIDDNWVPLDNWRVFSTNS